MNVAGRSTEYLNRMCETFRAFPDWFESGAMLQIQLDQSCSPLVDSGVCAEILFCFDKLSVVCP